MKKEKIINDIKNKFPILKSKINGKKLSYLDNAAMTQVPKNTINIFNYYYSNLNSNIHRSSYYISEKSTEKYEQVREDIKNFIHAEHASECIFVKNTTEGINLVANSYFKNIANDDDEVLISEMEHHSNIVPWYLISKEKKINIKVIPLKKSGDLDYDKIKYLINDKTKLISIMHISNSIGTINNIEYIIQEAKKKNIPVLIDAAQSIGNDLNINVKNLNCDFLTLSSHKMYGPNGLGVLYAKKKYLEEMKPYQGGGDMVKRVSFSEIIWNDIPYKFEAGTQSIANVIAFAETLNFINNCDINVLLAYKKELLEYTLNILSEIKNLDIIGHPEKRSNIISFTLKNIHPHDFGTIANYHGVAVRTGHHCAMPLMDFYNIPGTIRLSLSFYNTKTDINKLIKAIIEAKKIFK
ncbi:MAG TPA: aminotransferase class V-fold PLP-dependent enzyme [Candidatus Azoamicus sp.]